MDAHSLLPYLNHYNSSEAHSPGTTLLADFRSISSVLPCISSKMVTSLAKRKKATFLSLPDDVLAKIFMFICGRIGYTLTGAIGGLSLARTNTRLQRIFGSLLTHITPVFNNCRATGFAEQDVEALVRIAGDNLRVLHIPDCRHAYIHELPRLCPNLEAISYREKREDEFAFACARPYVQQNGADDDGEEGDGGVHDADHEDADDNGDVEDNNNNAGVNDNFCYLHLDCTDNGWTRRPDRAFVGLLPLRSLSVFNSTIQLHSLAHGSLQELRLYNIKQKELPQVTAHLSDQLKHLTITMIWSLKESECFKTFMKCLLRVVPQLDSITLHTGSGSLTLWMFENTDNIRAIHFLEDVRPLIALARENKLQSKCMTVNLKGSETWPLLKAVNPDASITLSGDMVSARDNGKGLEIIELPLDDLFLNQNVTYLEKAHIFKDGAGEFELNLDWRLRLAGHRLRVIRTDMIWVLNALKISTERLELYCEALPEVTDWTFLSGVREIYLIGTPWLFGRFVQQVQFDSFIEAMIGMVDEFRGEFIRVREYPFIYYDGCLSPEATASLVQSANSLMDAILRFDQRGGDAGTLEAYVQALLSAIEGRTESVNEISARTWRADS